MSKSTHRVAASDSNAVFRSCQSRKLSCEIGLMRTRPGNSAPSWTSRSAFGYGSARNNTPSTTLYMVVVDPIPKATVMRATRKKAGCLANERIV